MSVHPPALSRVDVRPLGPDADLLDAWGGPAGFLLDRGGEGVAGRGVGARVELAAGPAQLMVAAAEAEALLAALDGPGASEAVAVAALSYDGSIGARLTVPARTVRRRGGAAREVVVNGAVEADQVLPWAPGAVGEPREEPPAAVYAQAVGEAVRRIRSGALRKVVLARTLVIDGAGLDPRSVLTRLRRRDPACYTFAAPGCDGDRSLLVGATPELLVRRQGSLVVSTPLGGSARRSPDPAADREAAERLLESAKDRREHALVVEAVTDALAPLCSELRVVDGCQISATADMWHLGSTVRGTLLPSAPSALGLAAALHPTPAICGTPRAAALSVIHELEPVSRGLYSGIAGWVDARGDGEWAVTLRCAELTAGGARLYAGAGIVEGSVPAAEVAETGAKFSALLEALSAL